ncbi:MAG: beta-galactosidase trimerization domain-containing protein [Candidatus Hydrogenedentes bacterium]|nr:beta-galactosidase trimerization domain-containing protein [Candidatus Hydrogenedentota bacterium]
MKYTRICLCLLAFCMLSRAVRAADVSVATEPRQYAELDESFYNASFISWAGDNLADRLNLADPEAADARARRLAEIGVTGVLYNGRHFRLSYPEEYDRIEEYGRIVVDACHRHGIKVVEHHEFTVFSYASYPAMLARLDWLQTDIRTGEPWRWACIHNPDFLEAYGDYLASFARHTNADGYMLDEVGFASANTCGCPYCRASYAADLGVPFPAWTEGQGRFDDPNYRNVVRWRSKLTPRAQQVVMDRIREVRPDAMNMKYCSDYGDPGTAARAWDLTVHAARYSPFMGWEVMIAEALNGWRPFLRGLKLRLSYGNYYDIPVWSLNREMTSEDAVYFGWALSQMGKHSIWFGLRALETDEQLDVFARYNAWPYVMPHRHARCLTDTGLLLSNQTRFTDPGHRLFWNELRGWTDMLIMGNRQFDTLLDGDLELPGRLGKYAVLILISQASLTDAQIAHLAEWVHAGGTAIVTGLTATRDGYGAPRPHSALADAVGVIPAVPGWQDGSVHVTGQVDGAALDFEAARGYLPATRTERARVLANMTDAAGVRHPAVTETPYGAGRFLYVAVDLGSANYEDKARNRWPLRGTWEPAQQALIWRLYDSAHVRPAPARIDAPDGVVAMVYQEQGHGQDGCENEGRIHLHLLNTTGMTATPGYRFQYGRIEEIACPPVADPIRLHLNTELLGPAIARTPERDDATELNVARTADGTIIAIPGELLGAYLHVTAPARPVPGQTPQPPPIAADAPNAAAPRPHRDTPPRNGPWPLATSSAVQPEGASAFTIVPGDTLRVRIGEQAIIDGDGLDLSPHEYTTPPTARDLDTTATCSYNAPVDQDGWTGALAAGAGLDGVVWAREAAAYDRRIEITAAAIVPPGDRGPDAATARYRLRIPCALLKGARYTAQTGMHRSTKAPVQGTFTGEEPEDSEVPFLGHVRYMQIEGGPVDFFMDLNPCGPWAIFNEDLSTAYKAHFFRQGDHYLVVLCTLNARWGTKLANKIVIRLGKHDLRAVHPIAMTHYTYPYPALRRIQFTPGAPCSGMAHAPKIYGYNREFEAWQAAPYSATAGAGWAAPPEGEALPADTCPGLGPLFGGGWRGAGTATYRIDHVNGRVLCNVLLSGAGGATDCSVRVNDEPARDAQLEPGGRATLTIPAVIREGRLEVTLSGPAWTLSGIVPQLLMAEDEDYLFDRTWWAFAQPPWTRPGFDNPAPWRAYPAKF